ncbi:hypothetical protein AU476_13605 [Cupriavidus sp. UYMSc13B]|nr:hypothetical protein AU476_13605 [Cupriavidus sp. UYMSc13B]
MSGLLLSHGDQRRIGLDGLQAGAVVGRQVAGAGQAGGVERVQQGPLGERQARQGGIEQAVVAALGGGHHLVARVTQRMDGGAGG